MTRFIKWLVGKGRELSFSRQFYMAYAPERGAIDKNLIREWTIEINTGTVAVPVWIEVGGVTGVTPGSSKSDADTGDFNSAGWARHLPAARGRSLSVVGQYLEDVDTGARDPGQAAVEELGDEIGTSGIGGFRFQSPGGNGFICRASVDVTLPGGSKDEASSWGFALTIDGKPTKLIPA